MSKRKDSRELQLQTGPYRTTFIGTEIMRKSTPQEWEVYGEILCRVDEAKQWAIGDWLVDGKRHYGDRVYEKASKVIGLDESRLRHYKRTSECISIVRRSHNLSYGHHEEVASLKTIEEGKDGKLQISNKTDYEKIEELLKEAEKERMSVRDLRFTVEDYKETQREYIRLANEPKKYEVIYADPPWEYTKPQHSTTGQETVLEAHYSSMPLKDICDLPVHLVAASDAVLFLWTPASILDQAFQVIEAWGFEYKTQMIWDKVKHNVGYYVSVRHENLLICGRGQSARIKELVDSVYSEERTEHSKKPVYFRKLIERMYPDARRIELFARGKPSKGWAVWGDEVEEE